MNSQSFLSKILAVLEVFVVTFGVVPLVSRGIYYLFPTFEAWQKDTLGFPHAVFINVVMMASVLIILLIRRKKMAEYGLTVRNARYQLDIAAACILPIAASSIPIAIGIDYTRWAGALIMAAVQVGMLVLIGWLLRKKPTAGSLGVLAAGIILFNSPLAAENNLLGKAVVVFLTYAFFVGFGEEILFRGYMQSRLNEVFARPFQFYGVRVGWGLIITSLMFGLMHVGLMYWVLGTSTPVLLAYGFWTFFGGLVFGFVREKSGGILAPALLHGIPQAIGSAAMLFF